MEKLLRLRRSWPVLAICAFYIYLAFHALSGSQGLVSWVDYKADIDRYEKELISIRSQKAELEFEISALHADQLDRDMLDSKSREMAFISRPNEITIWLDR